MFLIQRLTPESKRTDHSFPYTTLFRSGRLGVSEWNSGQLSRYEPATGNWQAWKLPGDKPRAYAVYVDEADKVWVTDFGANAVLRFDPETERFESFPSDRRNAAVRQMLGREGEVWAPESGTDRLVEIGREHV